MDDELPTRLTLNIAAFRAIVAAVSEAEIGGDVSSVTISEIKPDLELMRDAVAVEVVTSPDRGSGGGHRETRIVAGDGSVVAHLTDRRKDAEPEDAEQDG
jgi:hypothetical protein